MEIQTIETKNKKSCPQASELGFGQFFTDHMFVMDYTEGKGWHDPCIHSYKDFSVPPSAMVFHYGQAIFEGLKAYRTPDDKIQLFRPRDNFERMNRSARGMCIPELDIEFVIGALKKLIRLDKDWVPGAAGTSLYIRPIIIATDPFLGVRSSQTFKFFIILSAVGAYYAEGFNPVKIWVSKDHVRAVKGGVGEFKTAGNYAASLLAGETAKKQGYSQVLWLDAIEMKYVEEVGAMNIFFVINDELITPALSGSILPGITRDSVIQLARDWGMDVSERRLSMDEVLKAHDDNSLTEVFGSGTAAVITPVGEIRYGDRNIDIANSSPGKIASKLYDTLTAIQSGKSNVRQNWIELVV